MPNSTPLTHYQTLVRSKVIDHDDAQQQEINCIYNFHLLKKKLTMVVRVLKVFIYGEK